MSTNSIANIAPFPSQ